MLGIDIGSTNLKLCLLGSDGTVRPGVRAHAGDVAGAWDRLAHELDLAGATPKTLVTGSEGRHRFNVPEVIAPVAAERGLEALGLKPRAVVSMGGEDLVVHLLDDSGHVVSTYAGNKCASGTGEFFRQQFGRMDLRLDDLDSVSSGACVHKLSARCSVFMKSDCTHRLNKGEATKGDIALSLSKVMADKVSEYLTKARVRSGQVVLLGGVTHNRFLVDFLRQAWPDLELHVPEQAPYFEAFGAAHLAADRGEPLSAAALRAGGGVVFDTFEPLTGLTDSVRYVPSVRGRFDPDADYILGVDGGSTTTKVALVHRETMEVVAAHYGRTHGDPVAACKRCVREVLDQLGGARPKVTLVATTGSSRELLGVFLETGGVYNEIIAHTVGTTYFESDVDTIFEIGGQDAKYVYINNGVPIDYAMNEACSAGTGSFLEESAQGDLNIRSVPEPLGKATSKILDAATEPVAQHPRSF